MLLEAVFHRPKMNWSYAYDLETIHLRIRTKRNDVDRVQALVCDKYAFDRTFEALDMHKFASDSLFDYWVAAVRPPYRRLQYGFMLQSGSRTVWMNERGYRDHPPKDAQGFFEYPYINPADVTAPPEWVKDAVFYQIFPERFANGDASNDPEGALPWGEAEPTPDNFFGGDLQGVLDKLDYLQELGVNALYFTPIFEATTNHKYDTRDYMKVDPHFGDNRLLKTLVDACHERGIRVMLDAVFNHAGKTFPPFVDVQEKGADSKYADWFHVRSFPLEVQDGVPTYETFSFEPIMPKFNTEHPEVREYLLGVAKYWVEEVGIDGWRLDVANEVDHQFWRDFRKTVKSVRPDAYILGEIWHDAMMWLQGDQFDAAMNYPFTNAVLDFFGKGDIDGERFANAIGGLLASYPQQIHEVSFNLLDSHDTPRLLHICGEDKRRMKLASLFQLTFYGAPCIYYGDEIGMTGEGDPGCRRCMEWEEDRQDRELFDHYRSLISLRKRHAALRTGEFRFLYAAPGDQRIAYERADANDRFVIAANASDRPADVSIPLTGARSATDVLTGESVPVGKLATTIALPAYGYRVLRLN